jgi:hypothetical protein
MTFRLSKPTPVILLELGHAIRNVKSCVNSLLQYAFLALARILREFPDLSVDFASTAWSIVRRGIVLATSQAGSAEMCREIRRQTGSGTKCIFSLRRKFYLYI